MKIREGFVSNSSSGSFIFPKGKTIDDVKRMLEAIEQLFEYINPSEKTEMGLRDPLIFDVQSSTARYIKDYYDHFKSEDFEGCVVCNTIGENSCPYWIMEILEGDLVKAQYIHFG